jgi:hypothetical protein
MDPNRCMEGGRTVQRYTAYGRECVRPIGKSWRGDPDSPVADTRLPVLVDDELFNEPQQLKPVEAERLMGMPAGCTAAPDISAKDRLKAIGNGWDVIITTLLLAHSQVANLQPFVSDEHSHVDDSEVAVQLAALLDDAGPEYVADCLMDVKHEERKHCLKLLKNYFALGVTGNYTVLDSGSARHLSSRTSVLNNEDKTALTGFDGSVQWTDGNGYLPIAFTDQLTGDTVSLDISDVDLMSDKLVSDILSLGKLLRGGYNFHLSNRGKDCYIETPGGAHKLKIHLGHDDILRIKHSVRTGTDSVPIKHPSGVFTLSRRVSEATSLFLHDVFLHGSPERIYRTLGVTKGYKQVRLKPCHCNTCAATKARDFGLRKQGRSSDVPADNPNDNPVMAANTDTKYEPDPVFDDNTDEDDGSEPESEGPSQYRADVAGRELGIQAVPRFDLKKLKLWEVCFIDNKDFPCAVRGGAKTALLFIDVKSRMKAVIELSSKKQNGVAMNNIISRYGIHKVPYQCRVYSDGCGSMNHARDTAILMGLDHAYTPPHQQSLNEAEKIADRVWADARALMEHSKAPDNLFGLAVQYVIYVDMRSATTESRSYKTPFEIARGLIPDVSRLHRFYTKCYVTVPKSKRRALAIKGLHRLRGEPGRFVGFQSVFSHTYAVMLDNPPRLVHSINVTFDDDDYTSLPGVDRPVVIQRFDFQAAPGSTQTEEASNDVELSELRDTSEEAPEPDDQNLAYGWQQPQVVIEPCPPVPAASPEAPEYLPDTDEWFWNEQPAGPRPRPNYAFMLHTTKDMDWQTALAGPDADKAIAALQLEMESLESTILTEIKTGDPEWEEAVRLATPGRLLLDIKRSGQYKARGVKQGFLENYEMADGPNFNYYAHVAKLTSIRAALFRYKRGTRRLAVKDVKTAFLQSDPYPEGTVKYVCFKDPLTLQWKYYRQSGPIYGEASAPVRWEATIAPFLESEDIGMQRGENEPCCFHELNRNLTALLYVDDCLLDGEEDDILWLSEKLGTRFQCKDLEWLAPDQPLDYLGMNISCDENYVYADMSVYIRKCIKALGWEHLTPVGTPMDQPIDTNSNPLDSKGATQVKTAIGMLGWIQLTVRPDVTHAHSRISQHQSRPTEAVLNAVQRCFRYLMGTHDYGIRSPLYDDYNHSATSTQVAPECNAGWEFFVDSDFASNDEVQNNRRSQSGYIAMLNGAPVLWSSKVSSVAFADERIGEAHADVSSGAAEVYAAANAQMDFLNLNHIMSEMNVPFPEPFFLQIDNTSALAFAKHTANRSRLKHIDVRQSWVKTLRDHNISTPVHVPTELNLADLFTKILLKPRFQMLRDRILHRIPTVTM